MELLGVVRHSVPVRNGDVCLAGEFLLTKCCSNKLSGLPWVEHDLWVAPWCVLLGSLHEESFLPIAYCSLSGVYSPVLEC